MKIRAMAVVLALGSFSAASAQMMFDDFEDGDASDWFFFGGNEAGGGGGAVGDRPAEGAFYLDTGWGGAGTSSVFYGGFFKNLENDQQLTLPADPRLQISILVQTGTTVDNFSVEITIREDTDGEGYEEGEDDSFQHVLSFSQDDVDDTWRRISTPLSEFRNLETGGDGTFNGNVDEIVIVIAAVEGGEMTDIQIDFDEISFASGMPTAIEEATRLADVPSVAELEHAYPNPFNPTTMITFSILSPGDVEIAIFNSLGQKVRTLLDGPHATGRYAVTWDASTDAGSAVSSGIYFYRMITGYFTETHRIVLAR